jgi:hypothetical protein
LRRWPSPIARAFRSHINAISTKGGRSSLPPFWIPLSTALARHLDVSTRIVNGFLWATTCLAHAIRVEDDLFDHDAAPDLALFAAPLLYHEAERTLACYFNPRSQFWRKYRAALSTTVQGIALAARMQHRNRRSPATLGRLYAMECAIFTLPLEALCAFTGTQRIVKRVVKAAAHLAIAGQTIDDLVDIDDDLGAGRTNLAAVILCETSPSGPGTTDALRAETAAALLFSPRLRRIFAFIHHHLDAAEADLEPLHLSWFDDYIEAYASTLQRWEEELQRARGRLAVQILRKKHIP